MLVGDVKNKINTIIQHTQDGGFKYFCKEDMEYKEYATLISDFDNSSMKCFSNSFGIWNDTRHSRERILEL